MADILYVARCAGSCCVIQLRHARYPYKQCQNVHVLVRTEIFAPSFMLESGWNKAPSQRHPPGPHPRAKQGQVKQ